jgi:hypothetical protein
LSTRNEQVSGSSPLVGYLFSSVLLATAEAREEEYMASGPTRGLKRSSKFETTKRPELRFRALLHEDGSRKLEMTGL